MDADPFARQKEIARDMPDTPGVYIMKDEKGAVIYVGKAIKIERSNCLRLPGRRHPAGYEFFVLLFCFNRQRPDPIMAIPARVAVGLRQRIVYCLGRYKWRIQDDGSGRGRSSLG